MTVLEIKDNLHRMVVETDDQAILEQIAFLFAALRDENNLWDAMSDAEKKQIRHGIEDIKNNKITTHEEVRASVRAILGK
jgi:hypothetical protein